MRRSYFLLLLACGFLVAASWLGERPAPTAEAQHAVTTSTQTEKQSPASGFRVVVDPSTGEFLPGPTDSEPFELSDEELARLNTSDEGLVERPSASTGVVVDLENRFQNTFFATLDEDGKLTVTCLPGHPASMSQSGDGSPGGAANDGEE